MAVQRSTAAKAKKNISKKAGVPVKVKKTAVVPVKGREKVAKVARPKGKVVVGVPRAAVPVAKAINGSKGKGVGASASSGKGKVAGKAEVVAKVVKMPSGLSRGDLTHFRDLLLEKRREILGDVGTMENEAFKAGSNLSNMPIHMADVGSDNFEQEFTLGLIESERQMLREIQEALVRIDDGSYGICIGTGKPIGKVRLEAVPWAKYSMDYARALEQGLVRRESGHKGEEESGGGDDDEE